MQLEDYFTFLAPNDIRIKGTRIGIETVLVDYLEMGLFAEQIAARYSTLTLEQIHATLTYYWHNRVEVENYLHTVEAEIDKQRRTQALNPSPAVLRLRKASRERENMSGHAASAI